MPKKLPSYPDVKIIDNVAHGYSFARDNLQVLAKFALWPLLISFANYIALTITEHNSSVFETFLMTLPATIAFAWYTFTIVRFQVLGEHPKSLSSDPSYLQSRHIHMKASVAFYVLYQMFLALISYTGLSIISESDQPEKLTTEQSMLILFVALSLMWSLKFIVLHIIAALGISVRDYIKRVKGMWFSYTLLGIGVVATMPILIFSAFFASIFLPSQATDANLVSVFLIYGLGSVMSITIATILNAAAVEALKQLYQNKPHKE